MTTCYDMTLRVDSRDVDHTGCARPSALLGYLQEAATRAALALHVSGPETLKKYNSFWMVARIWLRMDRPLRWNDTFEISTWHRGGKGASCYRDFDITKDGTLIGESVSTWVLADRDTYKLMRIQNLEEFQGTDGGERCKTKKLHRPKMLYTLSTREERPIHYSDTDINGHVNNVRYADFACDALHMEKLLQPGTYVRELQIGFLSQCLAGETLTLETGTGPDGCQYARGWQGGTERFEYVQSIAPTELPPFSLQLP